MDIGQRIRQIRGKRSRNEFAGILNIHPQTLYMYEKGKRIVDVELIQQICRKFNVSVEWLIFGDTEDMKKDEISDPEKLRESIREKDELLEKQNEEIQRLTKALISAQAEAIRLYEKAFVMKDEQSQNE